MSILDDADPLRSSLDRHLAQCSTSKSKKSSDKGETHIGKIRDAHGLCPSCGQQLYRIEQSNGGFLACCFGSDDEIKKVPLTIPRLVERGQCLTCPGKIKSIGDLSRNSLTLTEASSASSGTSTKSLLQDFPMATLIERDDDSYSGNSLKQPPPGSINLKPPPGSSNLKPPPPGSLTDFSAPSSNEELMNEASFYQISHPTSSAPWLPAGTAVYHGPYNDYGERHGESGEMIWSNGDIYRGAFVSDFRQGHGTLSFAAPAGSVHQDGGEYVGDWHQNQMHGSGTRRYPNGDVYMGDYVDGVRQGQGRFYYANGDLYWGSWQSNQMHGPGRYYYASGQRFEGVFQHGKRTGKGKIQRTDGALEIFQYVNDQRVGQGVRWSADRSKAWRLWMPSNGGRTSQDNKTATALQKQKMTVAEAVSLVYDIEQAAEGSMEGVAWASS